MSYPIPNEHVGAAMRAQSELNIFAAIVAILEGGTISGSNTASARIIKICQAEQQRQLKLMDKAVAAANTLNAQDASHD